MTDVFHARGAAAYSGMSAPTFYRHLRSGNGPESFLIGQRRFYAKAVLDAWRAALAASRALAK